MIGTGASAIQIVPEVQQVAAHLDVYQRTAPWVIPRNDRAYPRLERLALRHVPALQPALPHRHLLGATRATCPAFTWQPRLAAPAQKAALAQHRPAASRTPSCARR